MPIGGPLGQAFGVCAHDMSPADGCVVALSFGCGAHSEIALAEKEPVNAPTQDFVGFDPLDLSQAGAAEEDAAVEAEPVGVDVDTDSLQADVDVVETEVDEVDASELAGPDADVVEVEVVDTSVDADTELSVDDQD